MTLHALDAMMHGGIRDHLGGGFHRYSTDAKWLVPHFEIMLYDNAMLLVCYAEAYRQTGDARYAQVARDVADFVLREMTSPAGAFYTALDAEVDHQEGLNYLWTKEEIESVLGAGDAERFCRAYGVDQGPNFADPHHGAGVPDKNILFIAHPSAGTSPLLDPGLRALRRKLYVERMKRKQPLLDTKVLTSWNALMLRGLAIAGRILAEPRYVEAADKSARFLLTEHRLPDGGLCRTSRDGVRKYAAFLDDYAYLAWALTDLADATGKTEWRDEAGKLLDDMTARFGDADTGAFYFTDRAADDLFVRQMTAGDSPLPSGNAAAALALLAVGRDAHARRVVAAFAPALQEQGEAMGAMVQAALLLVRRGGPIAVTPASESDAPALSVVSPADEAKSVVAVNVERIGADELAVRLSIAAGWHVNAHDPGVAGLVGLDVTLDADVAAAVDYPIGDPLSAAFAGVPVKVHAGEVALRVKLRPDAASRPLRVTVRYQPCDDTRCLPPVAAAVDV